MRVLRLGATGQDVKRWQTFLRGHNPGSKIVTNGTYDDFTTQETRTFQGAHGLDTDGEVGPKTLGTAMTLGFNPLKDDSVDESGPNWPPAPDFAPLVSNPARQALFGKFSYSLVGDGSGEINITDNWESLNIVKCQIPFQNGKTVRMNKLIVPQFVALWKAWESAGLLGKVLTWDGGFVPRFVRGSTTLLSNHSWGTAFDLNSEWNGLGKQGALVDEKGSLRELVPFAYRYGFYWGRWFSRQDAMHFEASRIVDPSTIDVSDLLKK